MNWFGIDVPLTAIVGLISAIIAAIAALLVYLQWRERRYRKDDVLRWANDVIRNLQTLYITCFLAGDNFEEASVIGMHKQIAIDTSVLVEQGRLFFRNVPDAEHGKDRPPAYRGFRPELLDPIVVAHQIACQWDTADTSTRRRMTLVAEDCVRRFVSMAQMEVGRSKTAHRDTARGGRGDTLIELMEDLQADRIEALRNRGRGSL